jgi:chromate transporter
MKNRLREIIELFGIFFVIGLLNFGGGYSVLPFFKKEIVEKRGWATEKELLDYFVVSQCLPGVIAVNASTFIGYRHQRTWGAFAATLGMVLPAFLAIILIAMLFSNFIHVPLVHHVLMGINAAVIMMIFEAIISFANTGIVDKTTFGIFIASLIACFWLSPAIIIFSAGLFGFAIKRLRGESA